MKCTSATQLLWIIVYFMSMLYIGSVTTIITILNCRARWWPRSSGSGQAECWGRTGVFIPTDLDMPVGFVNYFKHHRQWRLLSQHPAFGAGAIGRFFPWTHSPNVAFTGSRKHYLVQKRCLFPSACKCVLMCCLPTPWLVLWEQHQYSGKSF